MHILGNLARQGPQSLPLSNAFDCAGQQHRQIIPGLLVHYYRAQDKGSAQLDDGPSCCGVEAAVPEARACSAQSYSILMMLELRFQ